MEMFRFALISSLLVLSFNTVYADWLPNWSFRNLLQTQEEGSGSTTTQSRSFNLSCTWSDEIFCYLDYFQHIPDSEIKRFYVADEGCRSVLNQTLCEEDGECQWTRLIGADEGGCYATITQQALERCSSNSAPQAGSLCSVWKEMDRCYRVRPRNQRACRQQQSGLNRCQWQDGTCFLHATSLIRLEFQGSDEVARYVAKVQDHCYNSTSRVQCEADHGIR